MSRLMFRQGLSGLMVLCFLALMGPAFGQIGDTARDVEQELELAYVQALQEEGLLDYADSVMDELRRRFPGIGARIKVLELQGILSRGRFDEARERINAEPDQDSTETWAMRMALADAYYAFGRFSEADAVFSSFFQRFPDGPDEAINEFYRDAAYRYAQMLLYINRLRPALAAYQRVFKADLSTDEQRQVKAEMGELLLRLASAAEPGSSRRQEYMKQARAAADDLLWIQDIWFGKGIVFLAHLRLMDGDVAGAQELVRDYMPQLREIDQAIREQSRELGHDLSRISPMAECRFLLGVMLHDEAKRLLGEVEYDRDYVLSLLVGDRDRRTGRRQGGALQHLVNVFIRFADTAWAPEAGERAEEIEEMLADKFGATVTKQVTPEQWERVRRNMYSEARLLFSQNQFQPAIERYLAVLNQFPDVAEAVPALGELARSYVEEDQLLEAEAVVGYLAERFARHPELISPAGDELVRLGEFFGDRNMHDRRVAVYDQFFRLYERHPLAPSLMFSFGERYYREENYEVAEEYFAKVASTYTNLPIHYNALSRQASVYAATERRQQEVRVLQDYIRRLSRRERPGREFLNAHFRLAQAIRALALPLVRNEESEEEIVRGNRLMSQAVTVLERLTGILEDEDHPYMSGVSDRERYQELLRNAIFARAFCLMLMNHPPDQVSEFNRRAIESFDDYVRRFPDSSQAPVALSQVGTLWTIEGESSRAETALRRLRDEYPDSAEARNALFMLGRNLMELGLRAEAVSQFRQMFAESDRLAPGELLSAGRDLLEAGEYELALESFNLVLDRDEVEDRVRGPALRGRARALHGLERFVDALKDTETILKDFPRTTLALEANLLQSRVASQAGMNEPDADRRGRLFYQASEAMKRVARYREEPAELLRVDLDVGRILARQARAEAKFASGQDRQDRVRRFAGQAVAAFLQITLNADPGNKDIAPVLQDAYHEIIPLLIKLEDWRHAFDDARTYLELFPRGRYTSDVQAWRDQARVELMSRGELDD